MGQPYDRSGREHDIWRHDAATVVEQGAPFAGHSWRHGSPVGAGMYPEETKAADEQVWWGGFDESMQDSSRELASFHVLSHSRRGSASSAAFHGRTEAASLTALSSRPHPAGPGAATWHSPYLPALADMGLTSQCSMLGGNHSAPLEPGGGQPRPSTAAVFDFHENDWPPVAAASQSTASAYMGFPSAGPSLPQAGESYGLSPHMAPPAYAPPRAAALHSRPGGAHARHAGFADSAARHISPAAGAGSGGGPPIGAQLLPGPLSVRGQAPNPYSEGRLEQRQMDRLPYDLPVALQRAAMEARSSHFDKYGKLRCLSCNKMLGAYAALEQHLASKHDGYNSEQRKYYEAALLGKEDAGLGAAGTKQRALYFQEVIAAAIRKDGAPPGQHVLAAYLREPVAAGNSGRGLQQYYGGGGRSLGRGEGPPYSFNPNPATSAPLTQRRGKESLVPKKKKVSALKKVILRERAEKAALSTPELQSSATLAASKEGVPPGTVEGVAEAKAGGPSRDSKEGDSDDDNDSEGNDDNDDDDEEKFQSVEESKGGSGSSGSSSAISSPKVKGGASSASYTDSWLANKQPPAVRTGGAGKAEGGAGGSQLSAHGAAGADDVEVDSVAAVQRALALPPGEGDSKDSTMRHALQEFIRAQQALVAAVEGQLSTSKGSRGGSSARTSRSGSPPTAPPGQRAVAGGGGPVPSEQALSDDIDRLQTYLESFSPSPSSRTPPGGTTSPPPRLGSPLLGGLGRGGQLIVSEESNKPSSTSSRAASHDGDGGRLGGDRARPNTYIGPDVNIRYCKQVITTELNRVTTELLKELLRFQERAKAKDPIKAKKKRRLVVGLREVSRAVRSGRAKCIIVAPNIEAIVSEGGLDCTLNEILKQAEEKGVVVVFALTKSRIAQAFGRRVRMSTVAICDYDGANDLYKEMVVHAEAGRQQWAAAHSDPESSGAPAAAPGPAPEEESAAGQEPSV